MLGFEDLNRDKRAPSGTHPPLLKGPHSDVVRLYLGAASPYEIVGLADLLKGAAKLEDLELTMGCVTLIGSLIGHLERNGSSCPQLRLIEALLLSREIRET